MFYDNTFPLSVRKTRETGARKKLEKLLLEKLENLSTKNARKKRCAQPSKNGARKTVEKLEKSHPEAARKTVEKFEKSHPKAARKTVRKTVEKLPEGHFL